MRPLPEGLSFTSRIRWRVGRALIRMSYRLWPERTREALNKAAADEREAPHAWDARGFHHYAVYGGIPWCRCGINYVSFRDLDAHLASVNAVVWETVRCPTCFAPAGLACSDDDGYRQPDKSHPARIELFYDATEYRGQ